MICYVHREPRFDKYMNALRERGGAGSSAVRKAEEIISRILERGRENSLKVGRLTRKGELRIRYGIKYDLGNGYRLVCAKRGYHLLLLYIGTHDECSRWLARNREFPCETDWNVNNAISTREIDSLHPRSASRIDPADEYEQDLMKRIDDKTLRNIFCGLVRK